MNRKIISAVAGGFACVALTAAGAGTASAQAYRDPAPSSGAVQVVTPAGCVITARITEDWVRIRDGAGGRVLGHAFRSDQVSAPITNGPWNPAPGWYVIRNYTRGLTGYTSSQFVSAQQLYRVTEPMSHPLKMITPAALMPALRDGVDEAHVDPDTSARARGRGPTHDRDRHLGVSSGAVLIGEGAMTPSHVVAVAREGAAVRLTDETLAAVAASRAHV